jgi:hypothetical protein
MATFPWQPSAPKTGELAPVDQAGWRVVQRRTARVVTSCVQSGPRAQTLDQVQTERARLVLATERPSSPMPVTLRLEPNARWPVQKGGGYSCG